MMHLKNKSALWGEKNAKGNDEVIRHDETDKRFKQVWSMNVEM